MHTAAFDLDGEELEFYDELTRYVEDQSIRASADDSARGRAVGFTMAMLQRRMASTERDDTALEHSASLVRASFDGGKLL